VPFKGTLFYDIIAISARKEGYLLKKLLFSYLSLFFVLMQVLHPTQERKFSFALISAVSHLMNRKYLNL